MDMAVHNKPVSSSQSRQEIRGWSVHRKIILGFAGVIALMALGMGFTLFKLAQVERVADSAIKQHQPAAQLFQRLSEELNLATTLLNNYLLTGEKEYKEKYAIIEQDIVEHLLEARTLTVTKQGKVSSLQLDEIEELLTTFQGYAARLFELRDNNSLNYPGMELAENTLLPAAVAFLSNINSLLATHDLDTSTPEGMRAVSLLQELRYTWVQMMSSFRLFLTTQSELHLKNFASYNEHTGKLLAELTQMKLDIGFGELETMQEQLRDYNTSVEPVVNIYQTDTWRADIHLMRSEVRPVMDDLRHHFERLADGMVSASRTSGKILTEDLNHIRVSAIIVLITAVGLGILLAMRISGGIIPPIKQLMHAAQDVAEGDLNAEVMITSRDEIGQLGRSFNTMVDNLRKAALNEERYVDDLKTLNSDLEDRVKQRTLELETSEAKIRAIHDSVGEGIIVIDEKGFIESINPAAERIFHFDSGSAEGMNSILLFDESEIGDTDSIDEYRDMEHGLFQASNNLHPTERKGQRADGSKFPMEFVVTPMQLGEHHRRVCIVRDITQRKQTEGQLADAQQQLVDAAHKSGMADMATGVLHNIGNILNSVSLSGEEIARITGNSKVAGLSKANEMLSANREDLGQFLTQDSKGQKLPDYYLKLGDILDKEVKDIHKEAKALIEKTTMMKEVISTQQAYARAGFHSEKMQLSDLVEDALKIQEASLHKWGVKIYKHYGQIPLCLGQKSKLLQVITNLIKNAKEAMSQNDIYNKPKELVIETGLQNASHAYLKIVDNGCGINDDQLAKIFNHGFTTKKEGHGFGLHSSANAMTEMKGSLRVESDGEQKGAQFIITLPVYQTA